MLAANAPPLLPLAFGASAVAGTIRTIPTTTSDPTAASLTLGFPDATFVTIALGGTPPNGEDVNGILNWLSSINQWQQAGGVAVYNSTFQTAISGYPSGAVLKMSNGSGFWLSTADNNMTNPDASGAGWSILGTAPGAYLDLSVAGNSNVTLTAVQTAHAVIDLGGTLTGNITVYFPAVTGSWIINNSTTGAYTVTLKATGGSLSVPLLQGAAQEIWCDATDVRLGVSPSAPAGSLLTWSGSSAPSGYLQCPTSATNISRTVYAALFAAIGTTWGAGDGSTTFGMPWFPSGYAPVQGTVASQTNGAVISHNHSVPAITIPGLSVPGLSVPGLAIPSLYVNSSTTTASSTGSGTVVLPISDTNGSAMDAVNRNGAAAVNLTATAPSLSIPPLYVNPTTTNANTTGGGTTGGGTTGGYTTSGGTTGSTGGTPNYPAGVGVMICVKY